MHSDRDRSAPAPVRRCPAAHADDPRPCDGRPDAVRIVDRAGGSAPACLLHGAVLLASLEQGRVYPLADPAGSAIAVFQRARTMPPFDFLDRAGLGSSDGPR
jgi:hypothetical protein